MVGTLTVPLALWKLTVNFNALALLGQFAISGNALSLLLATGASNRGDSKTDKRKVPPAAAFPPFGNVVHISVCLAIKSFPEGDRFSSP